jgi:hypothetical protein
VNRLIPMVIGVLAVLARVHPSVTYAMPQQTYADVTQERTVAGQAGALFRHGGGSKSQR